MDTLVMVLLDLNLSITGANIEKSLCNAREAVIN
jgi:hypothetical protein